MQKFYGSIHSILIFSFVLFTVQVGVEIVYAQPYSMKKTFEKLKQKSI